MTTTDPDNSEGPWNPFRAYRARRDRTTRNLTERLFGEQTPKPHDDEETQS